jgi:hypothetical protein
VPKNESFSSYLKDFKLSKFSDIWTVDKTHNKFLARELKMRFKLLNAARKLFLMPLNKVCLFYIISTQTIYIYQKFHEMNRFVKFRAVSKLYGGTVISRRCLIANDQITRLLMFSHLLEFCTTTRKSSVHYMESRSSVLHSSLKYL